MRFFVDNPFLTPSAVALVKWMAAHPPDLVFDVGANVGDYTFDLLKLGAKRVVAFEPLPEYAAMCVRRFAGDDRVTVHQLAMGESECRKSGMVVVNNWTLAEPGKTALELDPKFSGKTFDIEFGFIDSGLFGRPDFIKLDADGYEPAVLRGGKWLMHDKRPAILLELSYLPESLGYSSDGMLYDLFFGNDYVIVSMDGTFVCRSHEKMMGFFPWHTSFDVLAIPAEHSSIFPV